MAKKKSIKPMTVSVETLKPKETNPRTITKPKLKKLMESITQDKDFLQVRPIVVDEDFNIIGGNQRYAAVVKLGWEEVPTIQVTGWTEDQKKRFLAKDNITYGMWDFEQMKDLFDFGDLKGWGVMVPKEKLSFFDKDDSSESGSEDKKDVWQLVTTLVDEDSEKSKEKVKKYVDICNENDIPVTVKLNGKKFKGDLDK